jgi:hypothetical protein
VLPFDRFPDVDTLLGPEMKSTGEVMGIGSDFGSAYAKAQLGAGQRLPLSGTVFISVGDDDKAAMLPVAGQFADMGFDYPGDRRHLVPSCEPAVSRPNGSTKCPRADPMLPMRLKTAASS